MVPLLSKFGKGSEKGDDVQEPHPCEKPAPSYPSESYSSIRRNTRRRSYQEKYRASLDNMAEMASLKAKVQDVSIEVSQLADIPQSISQLKSEINELKQLLRESITNGV